MIGPLVSPVIQSHDPLSQSHMYFVGIYSVNVFPSECTCMHSYRINYRPQLSTYVFFYVLFKIKCFLRFPHSFSFF